MPSAIRGHISRAANAKLAVLIVTMFIPGGRVLVLPEMFTLILVLLYWAAKPRSRKVEE